MNKILRRLIVICMLLQLLTAFPLRVFAQSEEAVFAGGCFWCLEHDLEKLDGVISAESGYSGGDLINPTYENHSGHQEVVKVSFDSNIISYKELLKQYWLNLLRNIHFLPTRLHQASLDHALSTKSNHQQK